MNDQNKESAQPQHEETQSSCTNTSCCPPPKAPYVRETAKVGRNDPCICGNGRKYKKCCGKNA